MVNDEAIAVEVCAECILFHCNGELPENKAHAMLIVEGFNDATEQRLTFSANDLDDLPDWYGRRCECCFLSLGTKTSPTALILLPI